MASMENNIESMKITNEIIDKRLLTTAKIVANLEEPSNSRLAEIATETESEEINYINKEGVTLYSLISSYINWQAPKDHLIMKFIEGSDKFMSEPVRRDVNSPKFRKYAYYKLDNGDVLQVKIEAEEVYKIEGNFGYQSLMERLANEEDIVCTLYVDKTLKTTAIEEGKPYD